MIGKVKNNVQLFAYRLRIRNAIQKLSLEMVHINLEEAKREIERRNKRK